MVKWYVWSCGNCTSTMTINYDATEADYLRFKQCTCGEDLVWSHNIEEEATA